MLFNLLLTILFGYMAYESAVTIFKFKKDPNLIDYLILAITCIGTGFFFAAFMVG